jgi:4,5:9,10-diseco-3-hydroxy-5,9,17-trioxoandrosta-1(10),2-diene-4-oate hydrolase
MPERFASLSLVAPGAFGTSIQLSFRLASLRLATLLARFAPAALIRSSVQSCFFDPTCVPDWFYEHAIRYARAGGAAEFTRVMHYGVSLRGLRTRLRDAWEETIRQIRLPSLVVWGRQDAIVPVADLEEVLVRLPHTEVVVIDRAGHLVQVERPAEFNQALITFLELCRRSSTTTATRSPAPSR